jgi:hypothetical protein
MSRDFSFRKNEITTVSASGGLIVMTNGTFNPPLMPVFHLRRTATTDTRESLFVKNTRYDLI